MYSPWHSKADHLQRQTLSACRLERLVGNRLRFARRETDTNAKRKHNRAKRDTSSIQARVVYAEHCARWGALSKANQAVTSNSMPNADPINIDLRAKHPEPAHLDRDPVRMSSILWARPQTLQDYPQAPPLDMTYMTCRCHFFRGFRYSRSSSKARPQG